MSRLLSLGPAAQLLRRASVAVLCPSRCDPVATQPPCHRHVLIAPFLQVVVFVA